MRSPLLPALLFATSIASAQTAPAPGNPGAEKKQKTPENRDLLMRLVAPSLYSEQEKQVPLDQVTTDQPFEEFPEDDVDLGEEDFS